MYCLNVPLYDSMVYMTPKRQFKEYHGIFSLHKNIGKQPHKKIRSLSKKKIDSYQPKNSIKFEGF